MLTKPLNPISNATLIIIGLLTAGTALAQGPRAARVVTALAEQGVLAPHAEFQGTVFFKEVSEVATEVSGKVQAVTFETGERVKKGQLLVRLDNTLLLKDLRARKATYQRHKTDLQDATVRFERILKLVTDGLNPHQEGDEVQFQMESLGHQMASTMAEVERIEALVERYSIYSPFDGVALARPTDIGEWRSDGDTVAVIARENLYDVMVNVPERQLAWALPGASVNITVAGKKFQGEIVAVIPRGDIATRTFPIKIRIQSQEPLYEGMAASVELPVGGKTACTMVPRDALLHQFGETVLFTVSDGAAVRHRVDVLGYDGLFAGLSVEDDFLEDPIIIKGHERVRHGGLVKIISGPLGPAAPAAADD